MSDTDSGDLDFDNLEQIPAALADTDEVTLRSNFDKQKKETRSLAFLTTLLREAKKIHIQDPKNEQIIQTFLNAIFLNETVWDRFQLQDEKSPENQSVAALKKEYEANHKSNIQQLLWSLFAQMPEMLQREAVSELSLPKKKLNKKKKGKKKKRKRRNDMDIDGHSDDIDRGVEEFKPNKEYAQFWNAIQKPRTQLLKEIIFSELQAVLKNKNLVHILKSIINRDVSVYKSRICLETIKLSVIESKIHQKVQQEMVQYCIDNKFSMYQTFILAREVTIKCVEAEFERLFPAEPYVPFSKNDAHTWASFKAEQLSRILFNEIQWVQENEMYFLSYQLSISNKENDANDGNI